VARNTRTILIQTKIPVAALLKAFQQSQCTKKLCIKQSSRILHTSTNYTKILDRPAPSICYASRWSLLASTDLQSFSTALHLLASRRCLLPSGGETHHYAMNADYCNAQQAEAARTLRESIRELLMYAQLDEATTVATATSFQAQPRQNAAWRPFQYHGCRTHQHGRHSVLPMRPWCWAAQESILHPGDIGLRLIKAWHRSNQNWLSLGMPLALLQWWLVETKYRLDNRGRTREEAT
jgi:hypothetical protein